MEDGGALRLGESRPKKWLYQPYCNCLIDQTNLYTDASTWKGVGCMTWTNR